jgi:hypothetical protein
MDHRDLESWEVQEPPRGFADAVVAAARREQAAGSSVAPPRPRARASRVFAGLLVAAAMAAVVAFGAHRHGLNAHGSVTADARQEVHVGSRALAVLEKGAHVTWDGDTVDQSGGDVFWRVEPGARFVVHTPAADVTVKGTCFRVKLVDEEGEMKPREDEVREGPGRGWRASLAVNGRDARSGAVGAALAAVAFVGVYEGKVAVSHAGQSVDLVAGQSAEASAQGVRRVAGAGEEVAPVQPAAASASDGEQAAMAANASLADSVREYRRKLEAIESQKTKLEKQLAEAQAKLADGGIPKSEYDLSPDDLKELAKEGDVRMRVPCTGPRGDYSVSADTLQSLGLAPQDGPILQAAYQASHARTWAVIQPLCSQALGGTDVSRIGQQACVSILMSIASQQSPGGYDEDVRQVAEILAGERPAPAPGAQVDPLMTAYLALAHETTNIQNELAQSMGPDDAKRAVFAEQGCWWNSEHGVGPRKTP